jgi:hypothetical protein
MPDRLFFCSFSSATRDVDFMLMDASEKEKRAPPRAVGEIIGAGPQRGRTNRSDKRRAPLPLMPINPHA